MNKREAKGLGIDTGYEIAATHVEEARAGRLPRDCEQLAAEAAETESDHYRQFSPFEFTAAEFNRARDPDAMWEAYDSGVWRGIWKRLREAGCRGGSKGRKTIKDFGGARRGRR